MLTKADEEKSGRLVCLGKHGGSHATVRRVGANMTICTIAEKGPHFGEEVSIFNDEIVLDGEEPPSEPPSMATEMRNYIRSLAKGTRPDWASLLEADRRAQLLRKD